MSRKTWAPNEGLREQSDNECFVGLIIRNNIKQQVLTIGATAVAIPTTTLSKRRTLIIMNNSTGGQILYIGNSSVTTADGFPIYPRATIRFDIEDDVEIYGVASAAGAAIHILEGA